MDPIFTRMNSRPFVLTITVQTGDIDDQGHVNNVVYLRYVQEAAAAHWDAIAPDEIKNQNVWFVLRHEIDYLSQAVEGDILQAKTWVGETGGVRSVRFVELTQKSSGKAVAKARTTWCMLDAKNRRPKRIDDSIMALWT